MGKKTKSKQKKIEKATGSIGGNNIVEEEHGKSSLQEGREEPVISELRGEWELGDHSQREHGNVKDGVVQSFNKTSVPIENLLHDEVVLCHHDTQLGLKLEMDVVNAVITMDESTCEVDRVAYFKESNSKKDYSRRNSLTPLELDTVSGNMFDDVHGKTDADFLEEVMTSIIL